MELTAGHEPLERIVQSQTPVQVAVIEFGAERGCIHGNVLSESALTPSMKSESGFLVSPSSSVSRQYPENPAMDDSAAPQTLIPAKPAPVMRRARDTRSYIQR